MRALARAIDGLELPAVEKISQAQEENPFQVLIATLLSARTQDQTTLAASTRLFAVARTPRTMAKLTVKQIERLIYPVSFYRHKARHVKATCQILVDRFGGRVPTTMEELLTLPGVGRKTANLVLILAFKSLRNICVDTHVHRISNRLGWVRTRTPDETEQRALPGDGCTLVALHQLVPGDVGTECVPPCVSALRRVRHPAPLSADRRGAETTVAMMRRAILAAFLVCAFQTGTSVAAQNNGAGPVIVVETSRGTFSFETYPNEAPKRSRTWSSW